MLGSGQMGMSRIFPKLLNLHTLNPRKLGSSSLMLVVKLPHSLLSFLALQRLVRTRTNAVGLITCGVPVLSRFLKTSPSRRSWQKRESIVSFRRSRMLPLDLSELVLMSLRFTLLMGIYCRRSWARVAMWELMNTEEVLRTASDYWSKWSTLYEALSRSQCHYLSGK